MYLAIALLAPFAITLLAALAHLIVKIGSYSRALPASPEWIEDLSTDRYRPMLRMLDGSDLAFLRLQPGFTPQMEKRLRVQRTQLFGLYLKSLETGFGCVCAAIKIVMLKSPQDRPDLAKQLLRQQITFAFAMLMARGDLFLYSLGNSCVEVSGLVTIFDSMHLELRSLVPVSGQLTA